MDKQLPKPRKKYEHIWHAIIGACRVACYDFQLYKRSHPPIENPEVVYPERFQRHAGDWRYEDGEVGDE